MWNASRTILFFLVVVCIMEHFSAQVSFQDSDRKPYYRSVGKIDYTQVRLPKKNLRDTRNGSSPFRTRHINLNNNKRSIKPATKVHFHALPYAVNKDLKFITADNMSKKIDPKIGSKNTYGITSNYGPKPIQHAKLQKNTYSNIPFDLKPQTAYHRSNRISKKPKSYKDKVLQKNYVKDTVIDPNFLFDDFLQNKPNPLPKTESNKGELLSVHENPNPVPVTPNYPGEGKWAKRGKKYRPYVNKQQFHSELDDRAEHPEAEEIFQDVKEVYKEQEKQFPDNFLSNVKNVQKPLSKNNKKDVNDYEDREAEEAEEAEEEEEEEEEFVPTRYLAQVRKYENEEHNLPPIEPRLREVIKDSKTHTVFTEEGYEDTAYDHADHEKNAEKGEESDELHDSKEIKNHEIVKNGGDSIEESESNKDQNSDSTTLIIVPDLVTNQTDESENKNINDDQEDRDKRSFSSSEIKEKYPKHDKKKYPYYKPNINEYSPLRYSENAKNIFKKKAGRMSFYENAQRKPCQEIEDVDPIPKRITDHVNGKTEEIEEDEEQEKGPHIKNLGDKLDCYKQQLFGETPLDSPLFSEDISHPLPIFKELENLNHSSSPSTKTRTKREIIESETYEEGVDSKNLAQPESQALHSKRKVLRRRTWKTKRKPYYPPVIQQVKASTVFPKYKTFSEVQYKEDIKPNEQLNVYTDIIKNIKTYSNHQNEIKTTTEKAEFNVYSKNNANHVSKFPQLTNNFNDHATSDTKIAYTYEKPDQNLRSQNHISKGNQETITDDVLIYKTRKVEQVRIDPQHPTESTVDRKIPVAASMNNFYFLGMRPPPLPKFYRPPRPVKFHKRKYHRAKGPLRRWSRPHKHYHLRFKRSTTKTNYLPIKRKQAMETTTEEDDYVPRRNRNYHYDEKLGKIVYHTTENGRSTSDYIETTEEYYPSVLDSTSSTTTTTTERQEIKGPSFVEYILKLKSDENYIYIPDPKLLDKKSETTSTTTEKPSSTTEPEFLVILKKVKNNPNYKEIKEKNETSTNHSESETETAEITTENEKELLKYLNTPIKNSPGPIESDEKISADIIQQKSADNDYVPRPRNYKISSSIDTSKYSTIKRIPTVKGNDEEEEEINVERPKEESKNDENNKAEIEKTETMEKQTNLNEKLSEETTTEKIIRTRRRKTRRKMKPEENRRGHQNSEELLVEESKSNSERLMVVENENVNQSTTKDLLNNQNGVKASNRNRREEPRKSQQDFSTTTIRSRGRTRHKNSYQTTPPPRYRRRRTKPTTTTVSSAGETTTNPTVRRRRPTNLISSRITEKAAKELTSPTPLTLEKVEQENKNLETAEETEGPSHVSPRRVQDVEVFKEYDKKQKHGGNYRRINEANVGEQDFGETDEVKQSRLKEKFNDNSSDGADEDFDQGKERNNGIAQRHISTDDAVKGYENEEQKDLQADKNLRNHRLRSEVSADTLLQQETGRIIQPIEKQGDHKLLVEVYDLSNPSGSSTSTPELDTLETASILGKKEINNPNYDLDKIVPIKNLKKQDFQGLSTEYVLESNGMKFTAKGSVPYEINKENSESSPLPPVDFTDTPPVHKTVKKRIKMNPYESESLIPTETYQNVKQPILINVEENFTMKNEESTTEEDKLKIENSSSHYLQDKTKQTSLHQDALLNSTEIPDFQLSYTSSIQPVEKNSQITNQFSPVDGGEFFKKENLLQKVPKRHKFTSESSSGKIFFIKDPSKRNYYYAPI